MPVKKIILEGSEARAKLIKGALTVCRILGSTLGPKGRNIIIQKAYSAPEIVNDGGTIARHIVLSDPTEDLGAQTVVEATMKTNDRAGDGRSTTALLAGKIIETVSKKVEEQDGGKVLSGNSAADVISLSRDILDQKDIVIEKLKKMGRALKKNELKNVVATSIGKIYPGYIEPIAEMVEKVGLNGYISVEDNWTTKYGVENTLIEGMRFLGSYASPMMITDMERKETVWEDAPIFITNHRIENALQITPLIEELRKKDIKKMVIICEGYEKEFIFAIASSYVKNARVIASGQVADFFKVLAIKAPSLTTEQFEDVCSFTGAKLFNKNALDTDLKKAAFSYMGSAKKIVVDEDDTHITGGAGKVKDRIVMLTKQLDIEKDSAFKEQLKRRIGAMASGFGIIRVGASTETERSYVKKKITDAVNAAKAALEEGVLPGGGMALKDIAEELGKDNVLYPALIAPHDKIREDLAKAKIPATVLDALKVTRLAVENACSVAAHLITCEGSIADVREGLWEQLESKMQPRDNEDFRDDENQELKYRT